MSFSLLGFLDGIVQSIIHWFYSLLWSILMWFKDIFDFCYTLVRKLAGIDTYWYNGQQMGTATSEGAVTGDVVEAIIRSDVVRNIFISVLVLGIILLFIVTFISVWKTEWEFGKEGNSKGKIITASLKALFNFIAVPVIAMFGIFVGNALLRAIDSATAGGENVLFTDMIMTSVASNALRADYMGESVNSKFIEANRTSGVTEGENGEQTEGKAGIYYYFSNAKGDIDTETILYYFRNQVTFTGKNYQLVNNEETGGISSIDDYAINNKLDNGTLVFTFSDGEIVDVFFDTSKINYLLAFMVMFFMLKSILTITYGLVKRFFFVVILFIVSPPVVAVTPINSKALDEWRKQFVGHLTNAYVTIGLFNIFMSIFPIFEKIQFFAGGDTILNSFATLLMVAVGMLSLNEIIKTINEIFFGKGFDVGSQSTKDGKTLWGRAFNQVGGALKPMTIAGHAAGKIWEYGNKARYQGVGAAFKSMKDDTISGAKNLGSKAIKAGPLGDMWESMGTDKVKDKFKNVTAMRKDWGVPETKKAVRTAGKAAKTQTSDAIRALNGGRNLHGKKRDEFIENVKNDPKLAKYNATKKTMEELEAKLAKDPNYQLTDEEKLAKRRWTAYTNFSHKSKKETQNSLVEGDSSKKALGHAGDNTVARKVKLQNETKMSKKATDKAKDAEEAIVKTTAYKDAREDFAQKQKAAKKKKKK